MDDDDENVGIDKLSLSVRHKLTRVIFRVKDLQKVEFVVCFSSKVRCLSAIGIAKLIIRMTIVTPTDTAR